MKYLVEFNNGFENDKNDLTKGFNTLNEAIQHVKDNNDVYYTISEGDYICDDSIWQGAGRGLYTNCADESITWFYNKSAKFVNIEELAKV